MQTIRFRPDAKRVAFLPRFSDQEIREEPTLDFVSEETAAKNSGPICKAVVRQLCLDPVYQQLRSGESWKLQLIQPFINCKTHYLKAGDWSNLPRWHLFGKLFSDEEKRQYVETYRLQKQFKCFRFIASTNTEGVQQPMYIDEILELDVNLEGSRYDFTSRLHQYIEERSCYRPPQLKIQLDGEIVCFGPKTIQITPPAFTSGWVCILDYYVVDDPTTVYTPKS